jgi:hypothetical protein
MPGLSPSISKGIWNIFRNISCRYLRSEILAVGLRKHVQLPTRVEAKAKLPLLRDSNYRPSLLAAPREDGGGDEEPEGFPIIRFVAETSAVEESIVRSEV